MDRRWDLAIRAVLDGLSPNLIKLLDQRGL